MRTFRGPDLPPELLRSIGLVCLADAFVGLAFGAVTTGTGLPAWLSVVLSLAVFAGAAQFLFVGVVAAGRPRRPSGPVQLGLRARAPRDRTGCMIGALSVLGAVTVRA